MSSFDKKPDGSNIAVAPRENEASRAATTPKWQVLVWDDPINLMSYVSYVFRRHFGYTQERAESLMLTVHNEGKAIVATRSREHAEADVQAMHSFGLQSTMRKAPR